MGRIEATSVGPPRTLPEDRVEPPPEKSESLTSLSPFPFSVPLTRSPTPLTSSKSSSPTLSFDDPVIIEVDQETYTKEMTPIDKEEKPSVIAETWLEYADSSSLHGVPYIKAEKRSWGNQPVLTSLETTGKDIAGLE